MAEIKIRWIKSRIVETIQARTYDGCIRIAAFKADQRGEKWTII